MERSLPPSSVGIGQICMASLFEGVAFLVVFDYLNPRGDWLAWFSVPISISSARVALIVFGYFMWQGKDLPLWLCRFQSLWHLICTPHGGNEPRVVKPIIRAFEASSLTLIVWYVLTIVHLVLHDALSEAICYTPLVLVNAWLCFLTMVFLSNRRVHFDDVHRIVPAAPFAAPSAHVLAQRSFCFSNARAGKRTSASSGCSICLSEYAQGELITELACRHRFHKPCIDMWLSKNPRARCPMRCPAHLTFGCDDSDKEDAVSEDDGGSAADEDGRSASSSSEPHSAAVRDGSPALGGLPHSFDSPRRPSEV